MLDLLVLLLIRTLAGDKKGIVDFLLAVYCQFFFSITFLLLAFFVTVIMSCLSESRVCITEGIIRVLCMIALP